MAIIKCKMCGGDLQILEGASTAQCEYCGRLQTVPKVDDEKKLTLFARANRLRAACEFDKAAGIYEAIVADFPEEAEAYWGLVLCKYGIEYVDDPATGKKIPTCHRSSFDSILDDSDFEQALENANLSALKVYREEAKEFERIRKGILEVSSTEKPYDIFICYKETDANGDRTLDSVLAQDLYGALTDKGYRVFFSRITLQGKLGEAYEPYIFAALNSAKVMLAVGTCYEHYNAVWVKNEWSRYLKICTKDKSKHLIPCFKNLDPEDMPKEFNHLQGADLGKMGAVQDILFNMEKYIPLKKEPQAVMKETIITGNTAPMMERVYMFLDDGDWKWADELCEQVLNMEPKNPQAYLGKLMADLHIKKQEDLKNCDNPFDDNSNYQKAMRFADEALKATLTGYINHIQTRNESVRLENVYNQAKNRLSSCVTKEDYLKTAEMFNTIKGYKDSDELAIECKKQAAAAIEKATLEEYEIIYAKATIKLQHATTAVGFLDIAKQFELLKGYKDSAQLAMDCRKKAKLAEKEAIYFEATQKMNHKEDPDYQGALALFESIPGWKDANIMARDCRQLISANELALARLAEEKREEAERQAEYRKLKLFRFCACIVTSIILFLIFLAFEG